MATIGDGPAALDAGAHLADRRPSRAPRRRGRRRPRRRVAGHRHRAQLVRQQADRGRRRGQPADVVPDLLVGRTRRHRRPPRAGQGGRCGRTDPDDRLVVLALPGLGQPADPPAPRPGDDDPPAPRASVTKPRWLLRWARAGCRPPSLEVPNLAAPGSAVPTFFGAYGEWMQTPPPTWDDVAWLSEQWSGPLMLKGVMRTDDAKRAIDAGVTAISVSNHGGNNLDGSPAPIRVLRRHRRGRRRPGRSRDGRRRAAG